MGKRHPGKGIQRTEAAGKSRKTSVAKIERALLKGMVSVRAVAEFLEGL